MADRFHLSRIRSWPGVTCHILPPPPWCSTGALHRCCQGSVQRLPVKGQAWLSQVCKKQPCSPLLSCCKVQMESLVDLLIILRERETRINKFYFSLSHLCFFLPNLPISLSSLWLFFPHFLFLNSSSAYLFFPWNLPSLPQPTRLPSASPFPFVFCLLIV